MGTLEVVILICGVILCVLSFVIPVKKEELSERTREIAETEVKAMVNNELMTVKNRLEGITDETTQYAMEKAERSMERISNEKIMAVSEYSDTVLEEIHKNHQEVVFLYDMLNEKQESFKSTVAESDKSLKDLMEQVRDTEADASAAAAPNAAEPEAAFRPIVVDPASVNVLSRPETSPTAESASIDPSDLFTPQWQKESASVSQELSVDSAPDTAENASTEDAEAEHESQEESYNPVIAELLAKERNKSTGRKGKTSATRKSKTSKSSGSSAKKSTPIASDAGAIDLNLMSFRKASGSNSNDQILRMHEAGKSNMAIARELGLGIGEVQLVIDLYQGAGDES